MATVILTGFMGTGKTAVGQRLAERTGATFLDTDAMVERTEACSIDRIFAEHGEPYFRAAERRAVAQAVTNTDAVIATGGGAIVDDENYRRLHAAGPIVCLSADPETIVGRTRRGEARPLLAGRDALERVRDLLAARAAAYAKADLTIDTSSLAVDEVVDRILEFLQSTPSAKRSERSDPHHRIH
ncbi:MAG TPA: shikimate kinase [Candidatus Binatia bacterium]|nr:shikimate kinase [Candidatus Binatia bacterium]